MHVVTDDRAELRAMASELEALTQAREDARERLQDALRRAVQSGQVSESEAARIIGVNRQTVRTWLGKQDTRNRPTP